MYAGFPPPGPLPNGGHPALPPTFPPPGAAAPRFTGPPGAFPPLGPPPPGLGPPPGFPMPAMAPAFVPPGPRHIGLGAPGAPTNLPAHNAPPLMVMAPMSLPRRPVQHTGEVFRIFVGSIAEGVDDAWLEQILACAGPVLSLKRMREANGKPKAFGFAEYMDAESVWRCLNMLNGAKLPVNGGKDGDKGLTINVDEKTKEKIAAWESTRVPSEQDAQLDKNALDRLDGITSQMRDPTVLAASASGDQSAETRPRMRPTHLQDLAPEDLPEESRGTITKEIQFFREQAFKRESSKREEREQKISTGYYNSNNQNASSSQSGPQSPAPTKGTSTGQKGSQNKNGTSDPQSYNRPVGFVRAGQLAAASAAITNGSQPLSDEEEERLRVERKRQLAFAEYRERERRWCNRERQRGAAVARDFGRERANQMDEGIRKKKMLERLMNFNDENSQELFYADRNRWRYQRRGLRDREHVADTADARAEEEDMKAARRASEAFLQEQDEAFARIADSQRRAGGLLQLDDGTPIKLTFGSGVKVPASVVPLTKKDAQSALDLLGGEDEEDFTKKRELIPLTYDDDMEEDRKLTNEELLERENAKVRKLVAGIPSDKATLFSMPVKWEKVTESIIKDKLRPFANKKIVEYLGLQEDELVDAIMEHIKKHSGAQSVVEELEPVLAEEAEEFTIKFWRMLHYEIAAVEAGVKTSLI